MKGKVMKYRKECSDCNHRVVCSKKLMTNLDGNCPFYEPEAEVGQNPVDSMVRQGDQPVQNAGRWVIDSVGELKEILKQFDDEVAVLTDQSFVTVIYSINQDGFCSIDIGG